MIPLPPPQYRKSFRLGSDLVALKKGLKRYLFLSLIYVSLHLHTPSCVYNVSFVC